MNNNKFIDMLKNNETKNKQTDDKQTNDKQPNDKQPNFKQPKILKKMRIINVINVAT